MVTGKGIFKVEYWDGNKSWKETSLQSLVHLQQAQMLMNWESAGLSVIWESCAVWLDPWIWVTF